MSPTYKYRNKVTGQEVEVLHKITKESFKTWGELCEWQQRELEMGSKEDPVERIPNWEGTATIYGGGVYKQGTIAASTTAKDPIKANVTRYTIEDIIKAEEEDE